MVASHNQTFQLGILPLYSHSRRPLPLSDAVPVSNSFQSAIQLQCERSSHVSCTSRPPGTRPVVSDHFSKYSFTISQNVHYSYRVSLAFRYFC
jgi:hypothetical protein